MMLAKHVTRGEAIIVLDQFEHNGQFHEEIKLNIFVFC